MPQVRRHCTARRSRGFTLVELLTVVAVIFLIMGTLLPAIQGAREQARVLQCKNNLMQLGVALSHYNQTHGVLPPGSVYARGPITSSIDVPASWIAQILPHMGAQAAFESLDFTDLPMSFLTAEERLELKQAREQLQHAHPDAVLPPHDVSSAGNLLALQNSPPPQIPFSNRIAFSWLACPSFSGMNITQQFGSTNYAGCHDSRTTPVDTDNDGLLFLNSSESLLTVPDGSSSTILVGEQYPSIGSRGWLYGDQSTLCAADHLLSEVERAIQQRGVLDNSSGMISDYSNLSQDEQRQRLTQLQNETGTFGSAHQHHVNFTFADGSVKSISRAISVDVLQRLCSRKDGPVVSGHEF